MKTYGITTILIKRIMFLCQLNEPDYSPDLYARLKEILFLYKKVIDSEELNE